MIPNKKYRRLTSEEITPDTFNRQMFAYFLNTSGSEGESPFALVYFLLPVSAMGYEGGRIKVRPCNAATEFPGDADRGIWLPIADIWVIMEETKPRLYNQARIGATIMTVAEWKQAVSLGTIRRDDGLGYWVKGNYESLDEAFVTPQEDATHVAWHKK